MVHALLLDITLSVALTVTGATPGVVDVTSIVAVYWPALKAVTALVGTTESSAGLPELTDVTPFRKVAVSHACWP
jgi:hypothetical protein